MSSPGVTISEDVVDGMAYSIDRDGGSLDRRFVVKGLDSISGPVGDSQTLWLASVAVDYTSGISIPQYGQSHPTIPFIFCQQVQCRPHGRFQAIVTAHYGWQSYALGQVQIKITGTRNVLRANKDPTTQQPFVVTYTQPAMAGFVNGLPIVFAPQTGSNLCQFDISSFHIVVEFTRVDYFSPLQLSAQYAGCTNMEPGWQGVGSQPNLWMCQSINGFIIQNGWYVNTYVFEYAPEGWWQVQKYEDPATHIIPTNVLTTALIPLRSGQIANGIYAYVPNQQSFSSLGLPNV
jgi:hypothetical protein